jgi:Helix-turn-helix domain
MINIDQRLFTRVMPTLKKGSFEVLIAIVTHMDTKTKTCFPSEHRLMSITGHGRDSIRIAKKELEKAGLLKVWQEKKGGKFSRTMYQITTKEISIWVNIPVDEIVMESGENESPLTENQATDTPPSPEMPSTAKPSPENPTLTNYSIITNYPIEQPPTPKGVSGDADGILLIEQFDKIRKSYFGNKRGNDTEFAHFVKTCKKDRLNPIEILKLVASAIEKQAQWRELAKSYNETAAYEKKIHIPTPKHFQGWITSHRWTDELVEIPTVSERTPELDDTVLPSDISEKYTAYRAWVEKSMPKLAKSKCRILSKSEYLNFQTDGDYPMRMYHFTTNGYKKLMTEVHKEMNEKGWLLSQYATVWEYFKKQRTAKVNAA